MIKKITKPHDLTFKAALTDIRIARALLKQFLPKDLLKALDMRTLKLSANSFVTDELKEKMSDVVYSVNIAGQKAFICLMIEHQSNPDRWLAHRIFGYNWHAMEQCRQQNPHQKLPLIYTLVVYNGKHPFTCSTDIREDINAPRTLIDTHFFQPFQLIDLTQITDEDLRTDIWSGFLLLSLKHARDRNIVERFKTILLEMAQHFVHIGAEDYVWLMLQYLMETAETTEEDLVRLRTLVRDRLSNTLGDKMTTLAERLHEKGYQQGIEQGIEQGEKKGMIKGQAVGMDKMAKTIARKLLIQKTASLEHVAYVTNLPVSVIAAIQKNIQEKH